MLREIVDCNNVQDVIDQVELIMIAHPKRKVDLQDQLDYLVHAQKLINSAVNRVQRIINEELKIKS
jgi:hypothetical protein